MTQITKAVFPVGGMGSRFLPATKAIPKELLPIIDKPLIQYAVEEAIDAGIETLIFITSSSKHAISDHFDPMPDLREKFAKNKPHLAEKLDTLPLSVKRVFVPQGQPLGLGHAVLQAETLIDEDEMFAVILADDFIPGSNNPLKPLIEASNNGLASVSVERVAKDRLSSYGVIKPCRWDGAVTSVEEIIEKPTQGKAPSDYGVIGRYVLPHSIFSYLKLIQQDQSGEIQLTDALRALMGADGLQAVKLQDRRFDCGSQEGFVLANLFVAMQNSDLKQSIKKEVGDK